MFKTLKQTLALLLTLCMVLSITPMNVFAADDGLTITSGSEDASTPSANSEEGGEFSTINTVDDLKAFAATVNAGNTYEGKTVTLTDDINLEYTAVVIGTKANPFKGTFDGQNHIISNLTIYEDGSESDYFSDSDDCLGLFGVINTPAVVKNVTVDNPYIVGSSYVGGIVGMAYTGAIQNCHVTGEIDIEGFYMVGGITGHGYAKISDCSVIGEAGWDYSYVGATYKASDLEGDNVGGIVGHAAENNDITGCTVKNITVSGTRKVGGIVGITAQSSDITSCSVEGVIVETTATADYASSKTTTMSIGGIVGQYMADAQGTGGTLTDCSVSGLTFANENNVAVKAGALTGGVRASSGSTTEPAFGNVTVTGAIVSGVTGNNVSYCEPSVPTQVEVSTLADLEAFRDSVNAGNDYAGKTVTLTADLTLTGEWTPIGNGSRSGSSYTGNAFAGTFDGGNHTISGLTITTTTGADAALGLFGVVDGGTVTKLNLTNVSINVNTSECAGGAIGVLTGGGTASDITVSGSVSAKRGNGGIVGRMLVSGTIANCVNHATMTATGGANLGGIAGAAYYTDAGKVMNITNCINNGTVTGAAGGVGGIVGLSTGNVTGCTNNGAVSGANASVGGIVGEQQNYGTVSGNTNTADVTSTAGYGTGGIIGWVRYNGAVANYPLKGIVSVTGNNNSGSVIGGSDAGGIVGTVYNAANVTGNTNEAATLSAPGFAAGIVANIQFTETPIQGNSADSVTIPQDTVNVSNNETTTTLDNISANCKNLVAWDNSTGTQQGKIENNTVPSEPAGPIVVATTEEAQAALDAAKDGTIIQLTPGVNYGVLYVGRPTKSNDTTMVCETHGFTTTNAAAFASHLSDGAWHSTPKYTTNLKNVEIRGAEGATVAGVLVTSGHVHGNVYDYVLDKDVTSAGYYSTLNIENLTFSGVNFTGQVNIATSDATSVYDGVHFVNCTFTTGGTASSNGAAIRYYNEANNGNVKNITVENCNFTNCYQGVYTHHVNGVSVTDSAFNTIGHNAVALQSHDGAVNFGNVMISDNTFNNITDRVIRFGDVAEGSVISITGNIATNSGDEDGELIKGTIPASVAVIRTGNTWNGIADENLTYENGVLKQPTYVATVNGVGYATLADAAVAAQAGDEIVLLADAIVEGTLAMPAGIKLTSNGHTIAGSIRMLGDLELNGPLAITGGLWVGKSGETLTATLSGDKLTAAYFMFQHGIYTIDADIDAVYGYLSFEGTFQVNSTIHTTGANGEVLYINGNVTLNNGAVLDSDNSVFVCNDNAVLTLMSGSKIDSNVRITTSGAKVNIDATGIVAGGIANITGTVTNPGNGTISVMGNDKLEAKIVDGKIVLAVKPVAKIGETTYATLEEAFKAATADCTIEILADVVVDYKWDCRDYATNGSHSQFKESVTINGNDHTIKFTGTINDNNWNTVFRFEENATVNNLTIDISEATGAQRVITAKKSLTVDDLTIIGSAKYGIIFGEGASATDLAATEIVIENSTLTGTRRAISDNEGGKDVKSIVITGNTLNANVYVSASESIVFNNNTAAGEVDLRSYTADTALAVEAKGNTLNTAAENYILAKTIDAQDEFDTAHPAFKVATKAELNAALAAAADGDTIILIADIDYGTDQLKIENAITLDLGGKTLTTRNAYGGMSVKNNPTIKNGTIVHASNTAAIKVWNAVAFENLVIDVQGKGDANKTIGGIVLQSGTTTRVDSIKNVTIKGAALTNGIETYNCGDATADVIGSMENVTIDANGTGMLISAPCGTATNCTINGGNNAIEIFVKGNYSASLDLVDCDVEGSIFAHDEFSSDPTIVNNGTLNLTVDASTTGADDVTLTLARAENVEGLLKDIKDNAQATVNNTYYATLAEAIAAAQAGDTVKVFAGTYALPSMKAGITIEGAVNANGTPAVLFEGTLSGTLENLTLKNIHIKGGNAQRWAYAKGNLVFENCIFEATSVYALHFDGITEGATLLYKDCTIIGWAAMSGSPASCVFDGCTIKGNGSYGVIRTYFDATIENCTFDVDNVNQNDVYQDGIHAVGGAELVVNNCTNANGDMKDLVNISGSSVVVLDGVKIKNVAKIGDSYYATIADAIKAANAGETVTILAGDYTTDITLNKAITLAGETDENGNNLVNITGRIAAYTGSTVKNLNVNNTKTGDYDCALVVNGKDIVIDSVKLTGYNAMRYCYATGDITIKNSTINGSNFAVHFDGSAGGNIVFENCDITGWCSYASTVDSVSYTECAIDQGNYSGHRYYNKNISFTECDFADGMKIDLKASGSNVAFIDNDMTMEEVKALFTDPYRVVNGNVTLNGTKATYVASANGKYYDDLQGCIDDLPAGTATYWVYLRSDVVLSNTLTIPAGKKLALNLNGYNISGTHGSEYSMIHVLNGAELTIEGNGKISYAAGGNNIGAAIWVEGKLTQESGTIEVTGTWTLGFNVDLRPNAWGTAHTTGASFTMNGGKIVSSDTAIRVASNSSDSYPELGVTFTMNGGEIISTHDAIFVQHLYNGDLDVKVVAGTVSGNNSALRIYGDAGSDVDIDVAGGKFTGAIKVADAYVNTDAIELTGGTYSVDISEYCADGFKAEANSDGTYEVVEYYLSGSGTEAKPYIINNVEDLIFFRDSVNAGETKYNAAGVYVALGADIDLASVANWTPIGNVAYDSKYVPVDASKVFSGVFNGNGKVISNLKMSKNIGGSDPANAAANLGLFGVTGEGAVIKNLTITNVTITSDGRNVAAVVGHAHKTTLDNITVNGIISIEGGHYVGGICGLTRTMISATNLTVSGNTGSTIVGKNIVGGIFPEIAPNGNAQTFNNLNVENVAITGVSGVGGIVGLLTLGTIDTASVNNVVITANTLYQGNAMGRIRMGSVAGLMGGNYATIKNATVANVTAKNLDGNAVELPIIGANYDASSNATEAKIGDTYYATFAKALAAVKADETVDLLADIEATEVILIDKSITINGNGHKVTSSATRVFRVTTANVEVTLNDVNMVSTAVRVGTNDVRGISIDIVDNVALTLNNCYVDFTDASANDWAYAVNVTGGSNHTLTVNDGTYEGANVINVNGTNSIIVVENAILNSTYPNNDLYYGACIYVVQDTVSSVSATGNTFNGTNAIAFNIGYTPVTESNNTDNTTKVVAKIGDTYYTSLAKAFEAATNDETVKLLQNVELSETIKVNANVTLDLNGKTITGTDNATGNFALIEIQLGKELTIDGDGKITLTAVNNRGWNAYSSVISNQRGKLTVEGGTIEHLGGTDMAYGIDNLTNGKGTYAETIINGGTIKSTYRAIRQFLNGVEAQNILTVNGGTIEGANKSIWMQDPNKNANSGTLTVSENAKLVGDVYLFVTEGSTEWSVQVSIANAAFEGTSTVITGNVPEGYVVENANGTWGVRTANYVAEVNGTKYESIQAAIDAANAGETITLLADVTEDVTVNKSVTIDGADKTYTGTMTVNTSLTVTIQDVNFVKGSITEAKGTGGNLTVKNCDFDGVDNTIAYAITMRGGNSLVIEGCTSENYDYGMAYVPSAVTNVTVKDTNVVGGGYGVHVAYGTNVTLDKVTMTNVAYGIMTQNYGAKTITIKNCNINATNAIYVWERNTTVVDTFIFEGNNTFSNLPTSQCAKLVLGETTATLAAPAGANVTTDLDGYVVKYVDGVYKVVEALVKNATTSEIFGSIQEAIDAAQSGDEIVVLDDIDLAKTAPVKLDGQYNTYFKVEGKSITINLNGKNISGDYADTATMLVGVFSTDNNGHLTLTGNGTVNVTASGNKVYSLIANYEPGCSIIVANGTYTLDNAIDSLIYSGCTVTVEDGKVTEGIVINGGEFTLGNVGTGNNGKPWIFNVLGGNEGNVVVNGGTFNADVNHQFWANEVYVPETRALKNNGDETWTVVDAVAYIEKIATSTNSYSRKVGYATLADAIAAAKDSDTITLIWAEGDAPIAMNGSVFGKTVTITGTATVDWSKGFLFVGRGGEGNGTVIFDNAKLTSASNSASYGIHVSGREKNTNNKYDGTLIIKNSTIELDYLINKGVMTLDNSNLTVKNGFAIGGRPASETESGADATATLNLTNGSKVVVNNHNGMGLGYEAIGVMNIDATSAFETTQSFLVTAKGTMNIAGTAKVEGTLTNNGSIVLIDKAATLTSNECGNVTTDIADHKVVHENGVYKVVAKIYIAEVNGAKYESLTEAIVAAKDGDTITFLDNINENVTVNKSVTIDGADKTYTGTMTGNAGLTITVQKVNFQNGGFDKSTKSTTGKYTIKDCTFDGAGTYAYPCRFKGANTITIENCTVKNYLYSFLYITSGTNTVSVKDVTVENCPNYAIYFASGVNSATIDGLKVKNSNNGLLINNTANRELIIKNCTMENVTTAINHSNGDKTITCTVYGTNDFGTAATSQYAKYVLVDENATLAAPAAGFNVTTNVEGKMVKYVEGVYKVVAVVAQIGEVNYASLAEAIAAAKSGDTVVLVKDVSEDILIVPAGVTLDLNGKYITIDDNSPISLVAAYGNIIDTAETTGGIAIDSGKVVHLQANNGSYIGTDDKEYFYLPLYDTINGCYKFFSCRITVAKDERYISQGTLVCGYDFKFSNSEAYKLLAQGGSNITIRSSLTWENNSGSELVYVFEESIIKDYGSNRPDNSNYKLTLTISGLQKIAGQKLTVNTQVISATGVSATKATTYTYIENITAE